MIRNPDRYLFLMMVLFFVDLSVKDVPLTVTDKVLRCLLDNSGHFATAFIAWLMVRSCSGVLILTDRLFVFESLICGLLSSGLDIDHFISAASLDFESATTLSNRPFLHCSSLLLITFVIMLSAALVIRSGSLHTFSLLCLTAWSTHHLRDSLRRGLFFCPFFQTQPLDYPLYLFVLLSLPLLVSYILDLTGLIIVLNSRDLAFAITDKKTNLSEKEQLIKCETV